MDISKQKYLFKPYCKSLLMALVLLIAALPLHATIEGSLDPESVVEQWSDESTYPKIIDINFSDETWPNTWRGETGVDCPSDEDGGYVNAIIETPANGDTEITYPVMFHRCTFANKKSYNGYAGATAAFCRQYYLGDECCGQDEESYNNWTVAGHTNYLEDNIQYDDYGHPIYGEAGFVQMCRDAYTRDSERNKICMHGWMEIDHIPYVERVQWSWSSTSWGRGIKCDYKIGDGDWEPLVWMGSEKHKDGYTTFSDQGYFMENVINQEDVSIRWRVWDGDNGQTLVQVDSLGKTVFGVAVDTTKQFQAPRVHKIRIFGNEITADQAEYARNNPVSDVGTLSDLESEVDKDADFNYPIYETHGELLAFPTAEGFGKYTTGGRGGQVVKVTTLANSGEGSLRWAVEQYPDEPITIVFDVSGEIRLSSELAISRSDWTLAGQTAPGEGIVITHNKVNCGNSQNFIIRNIRFRLGQNDSNGDLIMQQAIGLENSSNFIVDHCSIGWTVEENTDVTDGHFITMQYCISHEGLYNAGHTKGARGYGAVLGGSPATYHHNLLANNHSRSPRFSGARNEDGVVFLEYINNVNFNWGTRNACYGGENAAYVSYYNGVNSIHECNFMNNYYKPGPESPANSLFLASSYQRDGTTSWGPAKWYINGNVMEGNDAATEDNWTAVEAETYSLDDIRVDERIVTETPYYKYTVLGNIGIYDPADYMLYDYETAEQAYNTVISKAGTVNRDEVEQRVINDVTSGTPKYTGSVEGKSGIIDLETDAEGFYDYSTDYTVPVDTDEDGMPDEWETAHGLDPYTADQNTLNADGYTALEVYINGLMGENMEDDFSAGIGKAITMSKPDISYDGENNMIYVNGNVLGSTLKVYSTDGQLLLSRSVSSSGTSLEGLPSGILLIRVSGNGVCPRVLKVIK